MKDICQERLWGVAIWFFVAAGLFFPASAFSAGVLRLRCDFCRQTLQGRYIKIGHLDICGACLSRYPQCAGCGIPVRSVSHRVAGRAVCRDCVHRFGQCANCGDVLIGEFIRSSHGGEQFCKRCFDSQPKCGRCGLPHKSLRDLGGVLLCQACVTRVIKCSGCGLPILDKYYAIEHVPGQYCRRCFEECPHCDMCNRPVVSGGTVFSDGRRICSVCAATAVCTMKEAQDLLRATIRYAEVELGMKSREPFDFALVDRAQMAQLHDRKPGKQAKELGLYSVRITGKSVRPTVAILTGLPRSAFLETAAHEYAHHWQIEHNPDLKELIIIEGFAQWVAAQWLMRNKIYSAHAKLERNPDPVYGEGYRLIKRYAAENGMTALMRDILRFRDSSLRPVSAREAGMLGRGALVAGNAVAGDVVGTGGAVSVPTPAAVGPGVFQSVAYVDPATP